MYLQHSRYRSRLSETDPDKRPVRLASDPPRVEQEAIGEDRVETPAMTRETGGRCSGREVAAGMVALGGGAAGRRVRLVVEADAASPRRASGGRTVAVVAGENEYGNVAVPDRRPVRERVLGGLEPQHRSPHL